MIIGRLLMRLLLVPLGGCVAVCVAMLFVMVAHWNRVAPLTADDYSGLTTFLVVIPMLAMYMSDSASSDAISFLGINKTCVGALGAMSSNARHKSSS